jgi:orotate phosphoribosyltransferase
MLAEEVAKLLLEIDAVNFRFDPPFTYTTGLKSPIYTDVRRVMSFPKVRKQIVNSYIELMKAKIGLKNIDLVSGTATAAIPLASFIAYELDIPMIFVRSSQKQHGLGKMIEGELEKGQKVVIIEDMFTTGTSSLHNAQAVREAGGVVEYAIGTFWWWESKSKENFETNHIKPLILTDGDQIIQAAFKKGLITKTQKDKIQDWLQEPAGWAKRMGLE